MLKRGNVYRFNYLWAREHQNREESGRKDRPVCLVVRSATLPTSLFLFPITSQAPAENTAALEIPPVECRRANLRPPCWIILNEYNRVLEANLYDFASTKPIGQFSDRFLYAVLQVVKRVGQDHALRGVPRH